MEVGMKREEGKRKREEDSKTKARKAAV